MDFPPEEGQHKSVFPLQVLAELVHLSAYVFCVFRINSFKKHETESVAIRTRCMELVGVGGKRLEGRRRKEKEHQDE